MRADDLQLSVALKPPRVDWMGGRPASVPERMEAEVYAAVCALHPLRPGPSQDETLIFELEAPGRARLRYVFDRDFASQYGQTQQWVAVVHLDAEGRCSVVDWAKG